MSVNRSPGWPLWIGHDQSVRCATCLAVVVETLENYKQLRYAVSDHVAAKHPPARKRVEAVSP